MNQYLHKGSIRQPESGRLRQKSRLPRVVSMIMINLRMTQILNQLEKHLFYHYYIIVMKELANLIQGVEKSKVSVALKNFAKIMDHMVIRQLNGKPRPELDIDLCHGHPSLGTRIWDRRSGPVVDGSGPMQDLPLGA